MTDTDLDPRRDYPLAVNRPELITTPTGRHISDLTMENVLNGVVTAADLRISPQTLQMQAQIADRVGRGQLGDNFRRAAELIGIEDDRVLAMYRALRPNASTKVELLALADELRNDYNAITNAALVREAADVYERRGLLRQNEEE